MTTATDDQGAAASTVGRMALTVEPAALTVEPARPGSENPAALKMTRARASTIRPDIHCEYCGKRMSPGRHGRRRYCSNGCRQGAYKKRRRAAEKSAA